MKGIDAALEPIKAAFGIFKEGSKFMSALGSIGRIMGRLFFPITLIMTAYDTIKGMLDGFSEDGILGGLAGAINALDLGYLFAAVRSGRLCLFSAQPDTTSNHLEIIENIII